MATELHEERESLWIVIASPMIWAAHFLLSYLTASTICGRFAPLTSSPWETVRLLIGGYTVAAVIGISIVLWHSRHGFKWSAVPHDFDTPHDRYRFLGFASVLLSGLSIAATLYASLTIVFVPGCR